MTNEERENNEKRDKRKDLDAGLEAAAKIKELMPNPPSENVRREYEGLLYYLVKEARDLYEKEENKS